MLRKTRRLRKKKKQVRKTKRKNYKKARKIKKLVGGSNILTICDTFKSTFTNIIQQSNILQCRTFPKQLCTPNLVPPTVCNNLNCFRGLLDETIEEFKNKLIPLLSQQITGDIYISIFNANTELNDSLNYCVELLEQHNIVYQVNSIKNINVFEFLVPEIS